MDISVIIVNYNVKHFLEQCLFSVQAALKNLQGEIIVIDNASSDDSIDYLQPKFPLVTFIANKENTGFGKACNQGYKISSGEFILFLNPDTLVPENCFEKCISFFKTQPEAGALGVKMVDGTGKFLKESKRSFPSLSTSFFKIFGLADLFPHSKIVARYYLGHLDSNQNHEVDVLAGAFMMIRRKVLEVTGGFDEAFFMYGEDIDLSYRIQKTICPETGGRFKNYYFAQTEIIHFKGESTKKGSLNYIKLFYGAMSIFVNKHYSSGASLFFKFFIHIGIWTVAGISAIRNFFMRILKS